MEELIAYKLLISYDVATNDLKAYQQFVMGRYIPMLQSKGFQIEQAWHTAYGNGPNRLLEFVCESRTALMELLESDTWLDLNTQLEAFVANLNYKSVPYRDSFQI